MVEIAEVGLTEAGVEHAIRRCHVDASVSRVAVVTGILLERKRGVRPCGVLRLRLCGAASRGEETLEIRAPVSRRCSGVKVEYLVHQRVTELRVVQIREDEYTNALLGQ